MSRAKLGTGRALSKPISWLLRDEFSDTRAAGAVNGTMPTPGPGGARVATDTEGKMFIGNGVLSFSGGLAGTKKYGDPGIWLSSLSRVAGTAVASTFLNPATGYCIALALKNNQSSGFGDPSVFKNYIEFETGLTISAKGIRVGTWSSSTTYKILIDLRAVGAFYFIGSGNLLLMWVDGTENSATLYPSVANYSAASNHDFIRLATDLWLPTPLVSDGFGSTFGTSDGLGHAETSGIGSGGGNVAWTQQVGTWTVSSSKAAAATLSGGVAVATVPLSTKDVFAKVKVTRSAGAGGLTLRWTDSSNYLYAEHDGTNAYLKQVLSGSTTTLITAAATYSAGAEIVADLSGVNGRLYYNNALVGSTGSINSGLTATLHGLRSTDTGGIQLDDLCIYAKGTGGEYNVLNRYVNL